MTKKAGRFFARAVAHLRRAIDLKVASIEMPILPGLTHCIAGRFHSLGRWPADFLLFISYTEA
ncbi:hypothetical protein [Mesorhizobium carmichaelinearum]|uniref:hypothetical protein n=1 Tax=Mesorhizobium carmichaelinearum TaxID=1208188 RepID=UPI000BA4DE76|nr:hypothetical protein [Mesorhizobium carmichaelinearum]